MKNHLFGFTVLCLLASTPCFGMQDDHRPLHQTPSTKIITSQREVYWDFREIKATHEDSEALTSLYHSCLATQGKDDEDGSLTTSFIQEVMQASFKVCAYDKRSLEFLGVVWSNGKETLKELQTKALIHEQDRNNGIRDSLIRHFIYYCTLRKP